MNSKWCRKMVYDVVLTTLTSLPKSCCWTVWLSLTKIMQLFPLLLFIGTIVWFAHGDRAPIRRRSRNFKYWAKRSLVTKEHAASPRDCPMDDSFSPSSTSSPSDFNTSRPVNNTLPSLDSQELKSRAERSPFLPLLQMKLRRIRRENKLVIRKIKELQSASESQRGTFDVKQVDDINTADLAKIVRSIIGAEVQRAKENYVSQLRRLRAQNLVLRCRLSVHEDRPR